MADDNNSTLKFVPFNSIVDPTFWHKLCQVKLDIDKLNETERQINGFYMNSNATVLLVDYSSFNREYEHKLNSTLYTSLEYLCNNNIDYTIAFLRSFGKIINFNSKTSFKELDKNLFIEKCGKYICEIIESKEAIYNPELLVQFVIITFADLKEYEFVYWFGFPTPSALSYINLGDPLSLHDVLSLSQVQILLSSHRNLPANNQGMFMFKIDGDSSSCDTIKYYIENINKDNKDNFYLCILDPSNEKYCPGWPLRNLLALIACYRKTDFPLNVICLRVGINFKTSFVLKLQIKGQYRNTNWIGWEKNDRGKFGPKSVNLKSSIDPKSLAETSVDLNIKLMKWRLVPELDLDRINSQKCLLLGAGTLGCSVARCLMGWGIKHITFIDNGTVSFSNPVRQSLYTFEDCDIGQGPKQKAAAAACSVKKIFPSMISSAIDLEIPMPGHSTASIEHAKKLHELIESHDVVFLLTDSRESRWFPTLLASALNKIAITAALGYDTYLVMRHGMSIDGSMKLGCYFCNDVTAPGNSMIDRTLDQKCTVTRPGVSYIASALAVELYISLLQHNLGTAAGPNEETILGNIPHSIRGFLSQFNQITPATIASSQCIACSNVVKEEYMKDGEEFLKKVIESSIYLENLTGLSEMQRFTEEIEILELSDSEEE